MMAKFFENALVILMMMRTGCSTPVMEYDKALKYEEYVIEHEISTLQATNSVMSMDIGYIATPPGCHKCTEEDKRYCLGGDLIDDHCCCDKRYHEMFPYIPHTCYLGSTLCKTVASDCTEYHRLRTCCCQKLAFLKWRAKSNAPNVIENRIWTACTILLIYCIRSFI